MREGESESRIAGMGHTVRVSSSEKQAISYLVPRARKCGGTSFLRKKHPFSVHVRVTRFCWRFLCWPSETPTAVRGAVYPSVTLPYPHPIDGIGSFSARRVLVSRPQVGHWTTPGV